MKTIPCSSCGAEIFFVTMKKTGGKMPLDAKPQKLVRLVPGIVPIGVEGDFIQQEQGEMVDVYTTHWATCPDAKKFRRPTSTAGPRAQPPGRPADPGPSLRSGPSAGREPAPGGEA
jgi:hypothetical protein